MPVPRGEEENNAAAETDGIHVVPLGSWTKNGISRAGSAGRMAGSASPKTIGISRIRRKGLEACQRYLRLSEQVRCRLERSRRRIIQ